MASADVYDAIGRTYPTTRRTDPRIAASIWGALGEARTVLNVGAGTGSYEPRDRDVVAVEPSAVMAAQRSVAAALVVRASAEQLPFPDRSFDAAMAVLSDHHWRDRLRGLRELRRVARHRVVLFNADPGQAERFWLTGEYLPGFFDLIPDSYRAPGHWGAELAEVLGGKLRTLAVPIPYDCADGFYGAFWRRPVAYLKPEIRAGISVFARLDADEVERGLARLRDDLRAGAWAARHADLLRLDALDLGYCVVIAELAPHSRGGRS
jgi:SAM-dependent methyltransferase